MLWRISVWMFFNFCAITGWEIQKSWKLMFLILDSKLRKFEIKRRNDKIYRLFACQIMRGLSYYIFIHISDKQNDMKIINMWFKGQPPVEITQVSRRQILSLLCLSRNVYGPKYIVTWMYILIHRVAKLYYWRRATLFFSLWAPGLILHVFVWIWDYNAKCFIYSFLFLLLKILALTCEINYYALSLVMRTPFFDIYQEQKGRADKATAAERWH